MLEVLTGRPRRLWPRAVREIGEALRAGRERLLLLVPAQFTLQAELELVDRLALPGFFNIEVLSPARLLTRVFALAGSPERVVVDERGKAMVLTDALRKTRRALAYYGGAAERRGFADRLSQTIADFKRAEMPPEAVEALSDSLAPGDALREKLTDIARIYRAYEEGLSGAFLDGEDAREAMLQRLPASGLLDGALVWIYGFDFFTPQFAREIVAMARGAESVRLLLTLERAAAPDGAAFAPARDALLRLARLMDSEGLLWKQEHLDAQLPSAPAIAHLESELFAVPQRPFSGDLSPVTLWLAANPYDEAMRTAAAMLSFARAGMPFDEMAVIVCAEDMYASAIEAAFSRSGIPFHRSRKRPALAHPLPRALLAALQCVTRGWHKEDALSFLKSGFAGVTRDEAELLENHAVEHGFRGTKWRAPIGDARLEAIRARFVAPLEALHRRLRDAADTTGTLSAAYRLLEDVDAYATLEAWQRDLTARGRVEEAADCAQAWRLTLETLDQLHALLHGEREPMHAIAQVIEAGLSAAELGALPAEPGAVLVGSLGHAKLGGTCRVMFILGLSDGALRTDAPALLSESEVARAGEAAGDVAAFGAPGDTLLQMAQIDLLDAIAAPTERLFISRSQVGASGEALRPAAVTKLLRRALRGIEERGGAQGAEKALWHAPGVALDALGTALREASERGAPPDDPAWQAAAWLLENHETRAIAERVIDTLRAPPEPESLTRRDARALYALSQMSVSRLESFASCPYKHFVEHGLRPKERREFDIRRDETGTFYHHAMDAFTKAAAAHPRWPDISREESDALMNAALSPLVAEWDDSPVGDNAMRRATGDAFCRVARRAAWTYAGQMRRGGFRTGMTEARFGVGEALPPIVLRLPDGSERLVEGRIDRIDFYGDDQARWLRVVDYKSGGTRLEPGKLYGGLQLQLMLYLAAALRGFPGVQAAGAFYSRFDDPLVRTDSRDVEEIEKALAEELRLRGIVLSDVRILGAMEEPGRFLKADGTAKATADLYAGEDLAALLRHAHALAARYAEEIASGEIAARPARYAKWVACQTCDYQGVCGFDPAMESAPARRVAKLSKKELLEKIQQCGEN